MATSQYRVDLAAQMADCDANYLKIMKLLPNLRHRSRIEFNLPSTGCEPIKVTAEVIDEAKYTSTVTIRQHESVLPWIPSSCMTIRVYHDARAAEVVSFQHQRHFKPRYTLPNKQAFQRDEKAQLNRFLGEWLSHCLEHGLTSLDMLQLNSEKCD